jgi:hypothetical protein
MTQLAPAGSRRYAGAHKALRKRLLAALEREPGQPCPRCGYPMWPGQVLHLDHTDDGAGWLGLSHGRCNEQVAQRKTAAILRGRRHPELLAGQAGPWRTSREW